MAVSTRKESVHENAEVILGKGALRLRDAFRKRGGGWLHSNAKGRCAWRVDVGFRRRDGVRRSGEHPDDGILGQCRVLALRGHREGDEQGVFLRMDGLQRHSDGLRGGRCRREEVDQVQCADQDQGLPVHWRLLAEEYKGRNGA